MSQQHGPRVPGIDVASYQGQIRWKEVAGAGVRFAFIKVSDGLTHLDPTFARNWHEARAAGVKCGPYIFFRPQRDAEEQARLILSAVGLLDPGELPPMLDVEAPTVGVSPQQYAAAVGRWVALVGEYLGRDPVIYTGPWFWDTHVKSEAYAHLPLCVAAYDRPAPLLPKAWRRAHFWQHTDQGRIPGIDRPVDLEWWLDTEAELAAFCGAACLAPPEPGELA